MATRVSGQNNAFGLSAPQIISFYENNIQIGENLNPRGFISPIAENALNFYRYKYEGAFFEEGRQISKIRVMPKRRFEPLFTGYINIIEDEWRIHSLQLLLTKSSGMELIDTLQLEQLYMPAGNSWVIKNQVIYPAAKMFAFDAYGSFVNVYSKYDLNPSFSKVFFDNTIIKYFYLGMIGFFHRIFCNRFRQKQDLIFSSITIFKVYFFAKKFFWKITQS